MPLSVKLSPATGGLDLVPLGGKLSPATGGPNLVRLAGKLPATGVSGWWCVGK